MEEQLLEVKNLRTSFFTHVGEVKAIRDVSFSIRKGEAVGIVGESGSGKSVTSLSIMQLQHPGKVTGGQILFHGEDLLKKNKREIRKIRSSKIAMIFQDPMTSLNALITVGAQISEAILEHEKISKKEAMERAAEMLRLVGIPDPEERLHCYPHEFSGGMRQRVMIAMALSCRPELLIADEPTTALDVTIQAQILRLLKELKERTNTAVILITHDLAVVSQMVDRINVMYCGKLVETGSTEDIVAFNAHPYTEGLLNSIPKLYEDRDRLDYIPGMVPNMFELPEGCYFAPRCRYCQDICRHQQPVMREVGPGHLAACHFPLNKKAAAKTEEGK